MKYYYLTEAELESYSEIVFSTEDLTEQKIRTDLLGLPMYEKEELKKVAKIGDAVLVRYDNKLVPLQIVDRTKDGGIVLMAVNILDVRQFSETTNKWKDCELRQYMNSDMLKKFDDEFIADLQVTDVHTEDYVTKDRFWLPSHEELHFEDTNKWFKPNKGTKPFAIDIEK